MKVIPNSNLVNWEDYPDAVCGIVWELQTDFNLPTGGVLGKGTKFTVLIDKLPDVIAGTMHIHNSYIWSLDGIGFGNASLPVSVIDAKELHLKDKDFHISSLVSSEECKECEA